MSNDSFMGVGVAFGIILILIYIAFAVAMVWAYVNIITRAGYSGWWVLMGLVPIGNIIVFFIFAFKEWPAQRELRELRAWANDQYQRSTGGYPPSGGFQQPGQQSGGFPQQGGPQQNGPQSGGFPPQQY